MVISSPRVTNAADKRSCLGFNFATDQGSGMRFQINTKLIDFQSSVHLI